MCCDRLMMQSEMTDCVCFRATGGDPRDGGAWRVKRSMPTGVPTPVFLDAQPNKL